MSIRPRGNAYQADVTYKGRRARETFPDRDSARAWELLAKAALYRGEEPPVPETRVQEGGPRHRSTRGPETFSVAFDRTYDRYWRKTGEAGWGKRTKHLARMVEDHFGPGVRLEDLDTEGVDGMIVALEDEGYADQTINHVLAVVSKVCRHAVERGAMAKAPSIHRKATVNGRIRFLSDDEEATILRLLRQWEKHDAAEVIATMIDTGFRNGEVWGLTPQDVDFKQGLLSLWKVKTNSPRSVYMTDRVRQIIERRASGKAPTERLFPFDNFWLRAAWTPVRSIMGLTEDKDFVPYVCRHTCASRLVQRGVPLAVVKEWMGHKTITMTMRYAHLSPRNLQEACDALNGSQESEVERLKRELAELQARFNVANAA